MPLAVLATLVSVGAAASAPPPHNVLQIERATDIDYVDPALAFFVPTWQIEYATCAKLLNYPDLGTPEGDFLYPEIAAGMPSVSPDGKSYEFDLRGGYAFPSGAPVTADTFKWTFDRLLHRNTVSPAQPYFRDIVGADEYIAGNAATVSGVVAVDTDTLRITLNAPAADFLSRLAMPFTCPLPRSVPISINGIDAPVPSAGPYYIDTWTRGQSIVIKENPNYVGARPHNFDEIRYAIGAPLSDIQTRITIGDTDFGEVPPAAHDALVGQYGPGSPAALAGRQRWFAYPSPTVLYLAMNHDRPLFGDDPANGTGLDPLGNVNLKKAVNYAIDRAGMIALRGLTSGVPTDQHLPPGVPGFRDEDIYPSSPDLTTARTLAGCTGSTPGTCPARAGELYCSNTAPVTLICQHVRTQLLAINLTMTVRNFNRVEQFTRTGTRGEPFDMTIDAWHEEYHDPFNFLSLLDGERLGGPGSMNNLNFAYFNDPVSNGQLDAANALAGSARPAALGDLDVDVARNAAPWAPYMVPNDRHYFSDRLGCHTYVPAYGISLGALCLRGDTVGENAGAGDTISTDSEADGATPADPLETSVTTPVAGQVSIEETPAGMPVAGYSILGHQVSIQAPAATPGNPLKLVFLIDGSLVPSISDLEVFRNGTLVPPCTGAPSAVPDPCVSERLEVAGDARLTVLTSAASLWNFGSALNTAPVVAGDVATVSEDSGFSVVDVLANDTDGDGDTLTVTSVSDPAHGTARLSPVDYKPDPDYAGPDSFTYTVSDGNGGVATGQVDVTVTPVNDAPVAQGQALSTNEDEGKVVTLGASDVEGSPLTYAVTQPAHGVLSGTAPNLTYTPAANYHGPDSFTFRVNDGALDSNQATVSITVDSVNDAPVAHNQSAVPTPFGAPVAITIAASDADGDALTYQVGAPSNGTLSGTPPNLTYTPRAGFSGLDAFTFTARDAAATSNLATVSITVQPGQPPPPPPPKRFCVVPNLKGKTVVKARAMLAAKRCALGKVTRAYSGRAKKGRIISQSKRPGARLARGTRVNVVVSRGRRR